MDGLSISQPKAMDIIEREIGRDPALKSLHTQRSYKADLRTFETWRNGRILTKLLVEEYAAELQRAGKAPNTINRALAAVRWWARRLADLAFENPELQLDQAQAIVKQAERITNVKDVTGSRKQRGRQLAAGELAALIRICEQDPTPAGIRDAAMVALAWSTGIRRDEIAGLDYADFQPQSGEDADLDIRGKGDKQRTAFVFDGTFAFLQDWLKLRGTAGGPLFCAINRGGHLLLEERLSGEALRQILEKRIQSAGVRALTWHDFRRSFISNLLDTTDLVTVQKLAGHSDPRTTSNYDRRGDEMKRKAVKTLFVPYHGHKID